MVKGMSVATTLGTGFCFKGLNLGKFFASIIGLSSLIIVAFQSKDSIEQFITSLHPSHLIEETDYGPYFRCVFYSGMFHI